MRIIDYGTHFHIFWEFDHWHKRNLETVKAIEPAGDRQYIVDPKKNIRFWWVAGEQRAVIEQFRYSHRADIILHDSIKPEEIGELPPFAELSIKLPWKDGVQTRPYQDTGIAQGMRFGRVLNGDEQGLGKTLESIGTVIGWEADGKQAFPCIVVCPASTKLNWQREWTKFSHKRAMVLDSKTMTPQKRKNWFSYVAHGMVDVVIVNYESLSNFCVESFPNEKTKSGKRKPWKSTDIVLKEFMLQFKSGILDESHRCKDATANQTKFILRIFSSLHYRILLSGTSVVNKPIDLYAQLAIMGTLRFFGGPQGFKDRYCDGGKGANNLRELNNKLNRYCYFRREKKDVAKDLPDKMRQTILCEITNRSEYNRGKNEFQQWLQSKAFSEEEVMKKMEGESILKMMQLKAIAGKGKMNEVKEFVNEVMEAGEKLILFCNLHEIVDECLSIWPHAVTITGRDDMNKRQRHIDAFQRDPKCQLIICNHKAAGVGITLTASSRVAFIEYPWTYADCVQCEDRAHRIGQVNNVMCTYFLGQDTVDERMWELISEKMVIGNTITGATDMMDNMVTVDNTLNLFNQNNKVAI